MKWLESSFLISGAESGSGSGSGRLTSLEGLRALAMLLVFNVHFFVQYDWNQYLAADIPWLLALFKVLRSGHIGVDLFFLLSGFFIYNTLVRNKPGFIHFIRRRYARIFPVLFITTIPMLGGQSLLGIFDNLSLLQLGNSGYLNFVTWTLTYEVYFYLIMAAWLILLSAWLPNSGYGLALVAALAVTAHYLIEPALLKEVPRFFGFFFGVLLARVYANPALWTRLRPWFRHAFYPAVIVIVLAMVWWSRHGLPDMVTDLVLRTVFYLVVDSAFFLLIASLLSGHRLGLRVFGSLPFRLMGTVSYSFYMVHALWVIPFSQQFTSGLAGLQGMAVHYVLALILSTLLAAFMFYYLERPYFIRDAKR